MSIVNADKLIKIKAKAELVTPLIIKSGEAGDISDSTVQKTPDGKVYINGYVIANLFCRAAKRLKNNHNIVSIISPEKDNVSHFWVESSFIENPACNIISGIKIDRELGSAMDKALYNDEVVCPEEKFEININFFVKKDTLTYIDYIETLSECFGIINSGIENIGGLWSYGFGRIKIFDAKYKILNLKNEQHRKEIWDFESNLEYKDFTISQSDSNNIANGWYEIEADFFIPEGQMLAIHSTMPVIENLKYPHLPDSFLYRTFHKKKSKNIITISGKSIRQALFSQEFERFLRTKGEDICNLEKSSCQCQRCKIFGSQQERGLIAVTDAYIDDKVDNTEIISRIELCEHSFQNKNLFSEEYLTKADFKIKVYIDKISKLSIEAKNLIIKILENMKDTENYPPHWYRIGANTTCAGILAVKNFKIKEV